MKLNKMVFDDKKIEAAANKHIETEYARYNSGEVEEEMICLRGKDSFKAGAKWAINEFLKGLWHSYDEVPTRKNSDILLFFEDYSADPEDDYDAYYDLAATREGFTQDEWELFMNIGGTPSNWLYINDLFPKEGGNHD